MSMAGLELGGHCASATTKHRQVSAKLNALQLADFTGGIKKRNLQQVTMKAKVPMMNVDWGFDGDLK